MDCIDKNIFENAYLGTKLKFLVEITAEGFSMVDNDFTVTLKRGSVTKTFTKSELVQDDEDNFYVCFDSSEFGRGLITATITAYVPDEDFDDGIRTEVQKFDLVNVNPV